MSVAESACGHACRWAVQAQPTKGSAVMGSHDVGAHGPVHTVEHGQALSARPGKGPGLPGSAVAGRAARRGKGSHRSAEARPIRCATNPIPPGFSAYLEGDKHGNEGMKEVKYVASR